MTDAIRRRYQRNAPYYDLMETSAERRFRPWRERLWSLVHGSLILEAGVGTGKNMPYYPANSIITAFDFTPGMLEQARRRARELELGARVSLHLGDVQALEFADATFDTAVASFVFCSVPNPVLGLSELGRVVRSRGRILLLEHMRSRNPVLGTLMDLLNPVVVQIMGANINRRTVDNILEAGLEIEEIQDLGAGGIFKLIVAHVA